MLKTGFFTAKGNGRIGTLGGHKKGVWIMKAV
jgi:hypothetical protein